MEQGAVSTDSAARIVLTTLAATDTRRERNSSGIANYFCFHSVVLLGNGMKEILACIMMSFVVGFVCVIAFLITAILSNQLLDLSIY